MLLFFCFFFYSEDDSLKYSRDGILIILKCLKKMYGLFLEFVENYIKEKYGEDVWEKIWKMFYVEIMVFFIYKRYFENIIFDIVWVCVIVFDFLEEEIMDLFGVLFVIFVG